MTCYYFIRHAEKEYNGMRDPHLTSKGRAQAEQWAEVLSDKGIDLVYCTPLRRTQETAKPLLEKLHLDFQVYDPTDLYNKKFQQDTKGKTVLVVGHQDTTPRFVNRVLKKREYSYISGHNHGNIYCVTISNEGKINSELNHIEL